MAERERDSQRSKVWQAESEMSKGNPFNAPSDAQKFAQSVISSRFFRSLFIKRADATGKPMKVQTNKTIKRGKRKGQRVSTVGYSYSSRMPNTVSVWHSENKFHFRNRNGILELGLPRRYLNELYVLHFLTWATLSREDAWHGRQYVKTMLKLIRRFMGELFHEEARNIYRKHRCKMSKRRKLPEGWVPPWKRMKGVDIEPPAQEGEEDSPEAEESGSVSLATI